MLRWVLVVSALLLSSGSPLQADEEQDRIAALIERLDSARFKQREAAAAELRALGAAAEPALERASKDARRAELAARAGELLREIRAARAKAALARRLAATREQRRVNQAALDEHGAAWAKAHGGSWLVISGGKLAVVEVSLARALAAAERGAGAAHHRFVFQAGAPTGDLALGGHGSLAPGDIGMGAGMERHVELLSRGRQLFRVVKGRALPFGGLTFHGRGQVRHQQASCMLNTGFKGGLVLDPATARRLELARFERPGRLTGALISPVGLVYPARRAWVKVSGPALSEARWFPVAIPTRRE